MKTRRSGRVSDNEAKEKQLKLREGQSDRKRKVSVSVGEKTKTRRSAKLVSEKDKSSEIDEKLKAIEAKEKQLKLKEGQLDRKDKKITERFRELEADKEKLALREKEFEGRWRELEIFTLEVEQDRDKVMDQVKELESRDVQLKERAEETEQIRLKCEADQKKLEGRVNGFQKIKSKIMADWKKLEERIREVDQKEKQMGARAKSFDLLSKDLARQHQELVTNRSKIEEDSKKLDERAKGLDLRSRDLVKKHKELEGKIEASWKKLDHKERGLDWGLTDLERERKELESAKRKLEADKKKLEERFCEVNLRERQLEGRLGDLEIGNKDLCRQRKELESDKKIFEAGRKKLDEQLHEIEEIRKLEQVKLKENGLETVSKEIELKENNNLKKIVMDGKTLQIFLNECWQNHEKMVDEVSFLIGLSDEPAKLVLDALEGFFPPHLRKGGVEFAGNIVQRSCILLLEQLLKISPDLKLKPEIKNEARRLSSDWITRLKADGEHFTEILGFLLVLANYGLTANFDVDELFNYVKTVAHYEQVPNLCAVLGMADRIPGLIQDLVERKQHLVAMRYAFYFNLVEKFPLVSLLRDHMETSEIKTAAIIDSGNNSLEAQSQAITRKLADLRAAISCIENYNISSEYSPANLRQLVTSIEKHETEQTGLAVSGYTVLMKFPFDSIIKSAAITEGGNNSLEPQSQATTGKVADLVPAINCIENDNIFLEDSPANPRQVITSLEKHETEQTELDTGVKKFTVDLPLTANTESTFKDCIMAGEVPQLQQSGTDFSGAAVPRNDLPDDLDHNGVSCIESDYQHQAVISTEDPLPKKRKLLDGKSTSTENADTRLEEEEEEVCGSEKDETEQTELAVTKFAVDVPLNATTEFTLKDCIMAEEAQQPQQTRTDFSGEAIPRNDLPVDLDDVCSIEPDDQHQAVISTEDPLPKRRKLLDGKITSAENAVSKLEEEVCGSSGEDSLLKDQVEISKIESAEVVEGENNSLESQATTRKIADLGPAISCIENDNISSEDSPANPRQLITSPEKHEIEQTKLDTGVKKFAVDPPLAATTESNFKACIMAEEGPQLQQTGTDFSGAAIPGHDLPDALDPDDLTSIPVHDLDSPVDIDPDDLSTDLSSFLSSIESDYQHQAVISTEDHSPERSKPLDGNITSSENADSKLDEEVCGSSGEDSLLKDHVETSKIESAAIVEGGNNSLEAQATTGKVADLRAAISCTENHNISENSLMNSPEKHETEQTELAVKKFAVDIPLTVTTESTLKDCIMAEEGPQPQQTGTDLSDEAIPRNDLPDDIDDVCSIEADYQHQAVIPTEDPLRKRRNLLDGKITSTENAESKLEEEVRSSSGEDSLLKDQVETSKIESAAVVEGGHNFLEAPCQAKTRKVADLGPAISCIENDNISLEDSPANPGQLITSPEKHETEQTKLDTGVKKFTVDPPLTATTESNFKACIMADEGPQLQQTGTDFSGAAIPGHDLPDALDPDDLTSVPMHDFDSPVDICPDDLSIDFSSFFSSIESDHQHQAVISTEDASPERSKPLDGNITSAENADSKLEEEVCGSSGKDSLLKDQVETSKIEAAAIVQGGNNSLEAQATTRKVADLRAAISCTENHNISENSLMNSPEKHETEQTELAVKKFSVDVPLTVTTESTLKDCIMAEEGPEPQQTGTDFSGKAIPRNDLPEVLDNLSSMEPDYHHQAVISTEDPLPKRRKLLDGKNTSTENADSTLEEQQEDMCGSGKDPRALLHQNRDFSPEHKVLETL